MRQDNNSSIWYPFKFVYSVCLCLCVSVSVSLFLSLCLSLSYPIHTKTRTPCDFKRNNEFYSLLVSAQRFIWIEFFTFNDNRVVSTTAVPTIIEIFLIVIFHQLLNVNGSFILRPWVKMSFYTHSIWLGPTSSYYSSTPHQQHTISFKTKQQLQQKISAVFSFVSCNWGYGMAYCL